MAALTFACGRNGGVRDWGLSSARSALRGRRLCSAAIDREFGTAVGAEFLRVQINKTLVSGAGPRLDLNW